MTDEAPVLEMQPNVAGFRSRMGSVLRNRFVRDVGVLAGATTFGQLTVLAASPVLTRLYLPEDFGALGVFGSSLATIAVFASFRYELALPIAEDDDQAADLLVLSILGCFVVAALTGLLVSFAGTRLTGWTNTPSLRSYLWMLPLGVLFAGTYKAANFWALRRRAFSQVAATQVRQGIGQTLVQLGGGVLSTGPLGLVLGQVLGQSLGSASLLATAWREGGGRLRRVSVRRLQATLVRFIRFPLYASWSGVLNNISMHLPVFVLAASFGAATAGLFALGGRVLQTPMKLIGQSIGQVFYVNAARAHREGDLAALTLRVLGNLMATGLPAILLLASVMPQLFEVVFGERWRVAGVYSQLLAPWLALVFVVSPVAPLAAVLELQRGELTYHVTVTGARIGALAIGVLLNDALIAVALFGICNALSMLVYLFWITSRCGVTARRIALLIGLHLLRCAPFLLPMLLIGQLVENDLIVLGAAAVAGLVLIHRAFALTAQPQDR
jgi:O-antigen/teichoic acid export membrane protein